MHDKPVKVVQDRNSLYCDTWFPELHDVLSYKKTEQERVRGRMKFNSYDVPMYQLLNGGADGLFIYGGLHKVLYNWLASKKIAYEVKDVRPPIPTPDLSSAADFGLKDRQKLVLAKMFTSHCGIFRCPPGFGKTYCISLMPMIYPDKNILIISTSGKVVRSIYMRTKEMCEGKGCSIYITQLGGDKGRKTYYEDDRIIVSTAASIHKVDPDWPDIVVYDECHSAATDRIRNILQTFASNEVRAQMFGFSASPDGRLDSADIAVIAAFGPILVDIPYADSVIEGDVVPLEAHIFPVTTTTTDIESNWTNARKERYRYWLNHHRNSRIRAAYDKLFLPDDQVIIIVKVTEHLLALWKLFPGALLVYNKFDNKSFEKYVKRGVLTADCEHMRQPDPTPDQARQLFADGKYKIAIATTMWKEGIDFPNLSGIIRADGMRGSIAAIQIGGRASRTSSGKCHGKLVDFKDTFDGGVAARYRDRIKHYRAQKWEIIEHDKY